jgi:hypothetical protein
MIAAVLTSSLIASASAQAPGYEFTLVADAGPGSRSGFVQIGSADLNDAGVVVFSAVDADGHVGVYTSDGRSVMPLATMSEGFFSASSPVINDNGDIAFVGTTDVVPDGLFLYRDGEFEIFSDAASLSTDLLGQLSIGNDDMPSVVYWSSCLGVFNCNTTEQCVGFANLPSPFLCDATPGASLAAPAVSGVGTVTYLHSVPGGQKNHLRLEVFDPTISPLIVLEVNQTEGFISSPSVDDAGNITVYAGDKTVGFTDGIYLIDPDADGQHDIDLIVPLDGSGPQTPLITTRPFLNDHQVLAYVAEFEPETAAFAGGVEPVEAIFADDEIVQCPIVAAGEELFGTSIAGNIQLFKLTDEGDMVATADLEDGRDALMLITDDGCSADINGDGEVNVLDLIVVIIRWRDMGCGLDVDNDGVIDKFDLLELIQQWGPCP